MFMKVAEWKSCSFDGAYDSGEYLYASSEIYNGMLKLNKETGHADCVCSFPQSNYDILGQHHKVHRYKNSLVFAPDNAKGIHVYDLSNNIMRYYAIEEQSTTRTRCIDSYLVENKLWLLYAYAEHPVVIVDLDNFKIEKVEIPIEQLPMGILERNKPLFWSVFTRNESKIYGAVWLTSYIVEMDLCTRNMRIIRLGDGERKFTSVVYTEYLFWCVEHERLSVTCWNSWGELVKEYSLRDGVRMNKSGNYGNLICCNKVIYWVTNMDDYVYFLDREKEEINIFSSFPEQFKGFSDVRKHWRRFFSYDVVGSIIRLYPTNYNMMLDIDIINSRVRGYQFVLEEKHDERWYQKTFIYPQIQEKYPNKRLDESADFSLKDYLGFISDK